MFIPVLLLRYALSGKNEFVFGQPAGGAALRREDRSSVRVRVDVPEVTNRSRGLEDLIKSGARVWVSMYVPVVLVSHEAFHASRIVMEPLAI